MRDERLDQETAQDAIDCLHALVLACTLADPLTAFAPRLVQAQQAALSTALDQLIFCGVSRVCGGQSD